MTIKSFALQCGVSDRTIQRRIQAFNKSSNSEFPSGVNDEIDNESLKLFLKEEFNLTSQFASADIPSGSSILSSTPIRTVEEHEKENEEVNKSFDSKMKTKTEELISERLKNLMNILDEKAIEELEKIDHKIDFPEGGLPVKNNVVEFDLSSEEKVIVPNKKLQEEHIQQLKDISKGLSEGKGSLISDLVEKIEKSKNETLEPVVQNKEQEDQMTTLQKRLSSDWLIVFVLLVILTIDMIIFSIIGEINFKEKIPFASILFAVIGLATGIGSIATYARIQEERIANIWKWCFSFLQFLIFILTINEHFFLAETVLTTMVCLVFIGVQKSIKK